ncbi:hypothetical protein PF005_g30116 [Phytophthora fragariae]|uniref:Uncharacterized protein n=1 Tax=Phytophthora fragariae TaxID=53985 RepID=A0A6A3VBU5_9STRA|nr:hypothetical protein PF003_g16381 [Phytophthora fragariae]KAE8920770.1 hypothetical protein PF009_g28940 [Phytophthora fragariae]KAE8958747.1 hypothetical protein PF011_g30654 [Phytophthora fragariae]KAE9162531.1 hypothetical protein PF002_g32087 [Phytophthora fragariae]KAE9164235.1 hypothetical protein PF005_g30116 [Phytophthora fragariae]
MATASWCLTPHATFATKGSLWSEGNGHMHYADGSVYVGEWKADVKCGQGVMTWMTPRGVDELVTPLDRYDGEC